jgi:hypothetical protein
VSAGTRELAERRAQLQLRCAMQRRHLASEVESIEQRLRSVDRIVVVARRVLTQPLVIVAVVAGLFILRPARAIRVIGRVLLASTAFRRLWRLIQR